MGIFAQKSIYLLKIVNLETWKFYLTLILLYGSFLIYELGNYSFVNCNFKQILDSENFLEPCPFDTFSILPKQRGRGAMGEQLNPWDRRERQMFGL